MTIIKALSVMAVLSTAIAAPVSARDAGHDHLRIHRGPTHHHVQDQHFRGAYNQRNERFDLNPQFQRNTDNFGVRGRDPSRIGGEDPDLNPSAF
jgi:hypothetical protein